MNTSLRISLIFIYIIRIFLFLNRMSLIVIWLIIELNIVIFIIIVFILSEYKETSLDYCLFYFLIQRFCSLGFLYRSYFLGIGLELLGNILSCLFLIFKSSLFPFQFWMFKIRNYLRNLLYWALLSLQKIPVFIIIFFFNFPFLSEFFVICSIFGSTYIFICYNLREVLICSSIFSSFWFFFSSILRINFFLFLLAPYTAFLLVLILAIRNLSYKIFSKIFLFISFLFTLGLPPIRLFFFKFFVVEFFLFNFGLLELLILWLSSFFCLFGYIKFFYKFIRTPSRIFNSKHRNNVSLLCVILISFRIFLI